MGCTLHELDCKLPVQNDMEHCKNIEDELEKLKQKQKEQELKMKEEELKIKAQELAEKEKRINSPKCNNQPCEKQHSCKNENHAEKKYSSKN